MAFQASLADHLFCYPPALDFDLMRIWIRYLDWKVSFSSFSTLKDIKKQQEIILCKTELKGNSRRSFYATGGFPFIFLWIHFKPLLKQNLLLLSVFMFPKCVPRSQGDTFHDLIQFPSLPLFKKKSYWYILKYFNNPMPQVELTVIFTQ